MSHERVLKPEKEIIVRKQHRCIFCPRMIEKGDPALRRVIVRSEFVKVEGGLKYKKTLVTERMCYSCYH